MSYANLNIIINTNAAQAAQSMSSFGVDARQALNNTQSDVERFRQSMADTAAANEAAAQRFQASMTAANDAVMGKAQETKQAMDDVAKATDNINPRGFAEKVAAAFGAAFGGGYAITQTWLQKTEDFMVEKGKAIAIGLALSLVAAGAGLAYTAYKAAQSVLGFIEGLFTGESMRSKSIDALIAVNNEVKNLQNSLQLSAVEAMALQDAMGRLGVDKSSYVGTLNQAATAMRTNTDELDRLGVKYKDSNGQLLTQAQFLTNVRAKLEEYKDGYDRSAAAAAIGAGSYLAVVDALKITDAQLEQSKARLDDYNLGIGPSTQAAVARYQQAMREFDSETQKTAAGFSRVIADSFMPMATAMAEWLKNGFPTAVLVFRGVVATAATVVYGLATSVGIALEAFISTSMALGAVVAGVINSVSAAMSGDFKGAKFAIVDAWEDAKNRMAKAGQEMIDITIANNKNIKAAWALDDRDQSLAEARANAAKQGAGKEWMPAPKPVMPEKPVFEGQDRQPFTRFMEELDRMVTKVDQSEYAMLRMRAAQEAVRQKGLDLADAMDQANAKINKLQENQSTKTLDFFAKKLDLENKAYQQQTDLLSLNAQEQDLAAVAIKRRADAEQAINDARRAGRPLDDQAIADLRANTDEQIKNMQALVLARQQMSRTADFGQAKAFQDYTDNISNQAVQVRNAWSNTFRSMEDALIGFVKSGKLNLASFFDQIMTDLIRIQIQRNLMGPIAGAMSNFFPFGGGQYTPGSSSYVGPLPENMQAPLSLPSYAVGTPYVPRDMLALVHEGEAITPKGANNPGINVQIVNNTQSQITTQSDGNGGLMVLVDMVKNAMAGDVFNGVGALPRAMESRYGLRTSGA